MKFSYLAVPADQKMYIPENPTGYNFGEHNWETPGLTLGELRNYMASIAGEARNPTRDEEWEGQTEMEVLEMTLAPFQSVEIWLNFWKSVGLVPEEMEIFCYPDFHMREIFFYYRIIGKN